MNIKEGIPDKETRFTLQVMFVFLYVRLCQYSGCCFHCFLTKLLIKKFYSANVEQVHVNKHKTCMKCSLVPRPCPWFMNC